MTRVTYYMYSCDTCCSMVREMTEMSGLDLVMCQIVKGRDISGINGKFNEIRQNSK